MAVERDVDGALDESRWNDFRDEHALGRALQLIEDLRPALAAVARHLQGPVVGARVIQSGTLRRFRERDDRWPRLDAIVSREPDLAPLDAHRHDVIAVGAAGEIAAHGHPGKPAVR